MVKTFKKLKIGIPIDNFIIEMSKHVNFSNKIRRIVLVLNEFNRIQLYGGSKEF